MQINKFKEFLSGLECISTSGYLTKNGDHYVITHEKRNKTLNTKQIVEIAEQSLSDLTKDRTSAWVNREQLLILSLRLKVYSKRVVKAKTGVWRALAFLGIRSWSEIKIYFLVMKIFIQIWFKQFDWHAIYKSTQKNLQKPEIVLKEFYFKILGSSLFQSKTLDLEGFSQSNAFFSMIGDVHSFTNQLSSDEDKNKLAQVINELHFAFQIAREDSQAIHRFQKVKEIRQRLIALPIVDHTHSDHLYTHLLLPGGYSGSSPLTGQGHAVNYQILREANGLFSFRIINSGQDISLINEERKLEELACKEKIKILEEKVLKTFDTRKQKVLFSEIDALKCTLKTARSSADLVFKNLTLNQLSDAFFTELLEYRFNEKKCFSMTDLIHMIEKHLKGCVGILEGRKHGLQMTGKGNCTTKSITLWLHERWGRKIHQQFKVHIAKQQMEKLDHLIKSTRPRQLEIYFKDYLLRQLNAVPQDFNLWLLLQQMQRAGFEVLKKREDKLTCIY